MEQTPVTIVTPNNEVVTRKVVVVAEIHQKGLTFKDGQGDIVLADTNNNVIKRLTAEYTTKNGEPLPITRIAGFLSNQAYDYVKGIKPAKQSGIVKKAGFILDLSMTIEENGETSYLKLGSTSRVMLSSPVDVASHVARTLLRGVDTENSEGYMTGEFGISPEGKLLMQRLGFRPQALPYSVLTDLMDTKRKAVKTTLQIAKKAALQPAPQLN